MSQTASCFGITLYLTAFWQETMQSPWTMSDWAAMHSLNDLFTFYSWSSILLKCYVD